MSHQRRCSTNWSFCAARSHPPGVHKAGSARLDRRSEMDQRHQKKEQVLVKVVTLEVTISGVLEDKCTSAVDVNRPKTCA